MADGIRFLDHTADLGMDVDAPSLHELLHRAAMGMLMLLRGEEDGPAAGRGEPADRVESADRAESTEPADRPESSTATESHPVDLSVRDAPQLVAAWLREVLYLHEVHARDYVALEPDTLTATRLTGRIWTRRGGHAVREIKGVTYHALEVDRRPGGWQTRIIFDV